jgi:predicted porin
MKKLTLVAAAAMGLLSSATVMAQSTVTLYGIVDAGYNRVSGLKQGTVNTIASGIMEGSRFGLRGTEDLGGGYKAIFVLENRFETDTGALSNRPNSGTQVPDRVNETVLTTLEARGIPRATPLAPGVTLANAVGNLSTGLAGSAFGVNVGTDGNRLFDRQAYVGVITPVGAVTLGRQYTPGYLVSANFDASQTQSSLAAGQVASLPAAFDIRLSNTIQYAIQTSGVTATLMYGAGEVAGNSSAGRFMGGMVQYKSELFGAGVGYNTKKNERGEKSLTNAVVGANVNVGPGAIYGLVATIKDENPSGLTPLFAGNPVGALTPAVQSAYNVAFRQDARLYHIGYRMTLGAHTIVTAFNRLDDRRAVNADTDSYGVTYSYALSKRTDLNAVLTRFNNKGQGQIAPGGNGFLGGVTSSAGTDSTNIALGIRHRF